MLRFAAARAGQTALVVFLVTSLAFALIHAAPGDAFSSLDPDPQAAAARIEMRHDYGLDRPLYEQYPAMLASFARGNLGTSFAQARPVSEVLRQVIPDTLLLMGPALLLGVCAGVVAGTWQGARAGTAADHATSAVLLGLLSLPEFIVALLIVGVFAVRLGWFPAGGMFRAGAMHGSSLEAFADYAHHAVLPVTTLALAIASVVARFQRAAVIDALSEEFVRTARAKGAGTRRVLVRHVLRRTASSLCTLLGLLIPSLVGGAAIVEQVFGWPGAGHALIAAVEGRDYPVVIALVTVGSIAVCVASALADAAAAIANPATRAHA